MARALDGKRGRAMERTGNGSGNPGGREGF